MVYSFSNFQARTKEAQEWLAKELSGLRSGRATPAILDAVFAEAYGAKTPVKHIASISLEDARTLRIAPYDASLAKEIEKAIAGANIGLSVSADEKGIRAHFPELTFERRAAIIKVAKEKFEQARITLRKLRDDVWQDIQAKEKSGGMGEDEKFRLKKELEKSIDEENKKLSAVFERKEREINS